MELDIKKEVGKRLREIRKSKNLSIDQLAMLLDITSHTVANIEKGRTFPTLDTFKKIIKGLEIELYELFLFKSEKPSNVVYKDVIKKLEKIEDNKETLLIISELIDKIN